MLHIPLVTRYLTDPPRPPSQDLKYSNTWHLIVIIRAVSTAQKHLSVFLAHVWQSSALHLPGVVCSPPVDCHSYAEQQRHCQETHSHCKSCYGTCGRRQPCLGTWECGTFGGFPKALIFLNQTDRLHWKSPHCSPKWINVLRWNLNDAKMCVEREGNRSQCKQENI